MLHQIKNAPSGIRRCVFDIEIRQVYFGCVAMIFASIFL